MLPKLKNVRFDNPQFSVNTSFDKIDFTHILKERFGSSKKSLTNSFILSWNEFLDDMVMTTRELFEKYFPGRTDVWRFLRETPSLMPTALH
ncbi:MAG: hypothetical protein CM1200mP16_01150 [Nitrospina sp.]|nr:MAG: hypothetical protein CM1200mP16_01150 [Nitrospina sp.]